MFQHTLRFFLLLAFFVPQLWSIERVEDGPIHEAFVTRVAESVVLDAIPIQPPERINEKIPKQTDFQAEWIPGYWSWHLERQDFVWVSGVWRRPPPGHQWISGFWKQYDEGWVWIPGFWSAVPDHRLSYIGVPPPDQIDEEVAMPPNNDYFWVSGYWKFEFQDHDYFWVSGMWELLDPHWVLVPSHYVWRPGGFVFVPAYWDWPIDERGSAFACVFIEPNLRASILYQPIFILDYPVIIRRLFVYYPDYICFFYHHHRYHPDFWNGFCCAPPWWSWDTWWCYTWHDHWALWWWYGHPGYPQPFWINAQISGLIPVPLANLLNLFKFAVAPSIITPNGAVNPEALRNAMAKVFGKFLPILPSDQVQLQKIFDQVLPKKIPEDQILKPSGKKLPIDPNAIRPQVRKPSIDGDLIKKVPKLIGARRPPLPPKPHVPSMERPPIRPVEIQTVPPRPQWEPRYREPPPRRPHREYYPPPVIRPGIRGNIYFPIGPRGRDHDDDDDGDYRRRRRQRPRTRDVDDDDGHQRSRRSQSSRGRDNDDDD